MKKFLSVMALQTVAGPTIPAGRATMLGEYRSNATPQARTRVRVHRRAIPLNQGLMATAVRIYREHAELAR